MFVSAELVFLSQSYTDDTACRLFKSIGENLSPYQYVQDSRNLIIDYSSAQLSAAVTITFCTLKIGERQRYVFLRA